MSARMGEPVVFDLTANEVVRGAQLSECNRYRYLLWRLWEEKRAPRVHFIMLNPSTADHRVDDATIRRCIGYGRRWGFGGLYVLNLYAYRATHPEELLAADDPVGPLNNVKISNHLLYQTNPSDWVVCAWGALHEEHLEREVEVRSLLADAQALGGFELRCLKLTKKGFPAHPLRLRADLVPMAFAVER